MAHILTIGLKPFIHTLLYEKDQCILIDTDAALHVAGKSSRHSSEDNKKKVTE